MIMGLIALDGFNHCINLSWTPNIKLISYNPSAFSNLIIIFFFGKGWFKAIYFIQVYIIWIYDGECYIFNNKLKIKDGEVENHTLFVKEWFILRGLLIFNVTWHRIFSSIIAIDFSEAIFQFFLAH